MNQRIERSVRWRTAEARLRSQQAEIANPPDTGGRFALLLLVAELCFICPECGSLDVRVTVPSQVGAYCRCDTCGHIWHDDQKLPTRGVSLGRRKSEQVLK
jgi:predicted RNA-binding Zn-ribbon protein involved in translation (DUF1610 family)